MDNYKPLSELIKSISKTHKFDKDELIFLNTSDVFKGKILINHYTKIVDLKGQAKKTIKNNDILYSEIRPKNKRYAFVKGLENPEDYVVSTKLMVLRNYSKYLNTDYLYHFLTFEGTLNYLQRMAENRIGSFPQITFDVLKNLRIWLPNKEKQTQIAKVLSDLDAKIELNNKINQQLEAMAKTLYDYWFVQFDFPDANGNPYKSSGGKMVYDEKLKREIPEGWEVKKMNEITSVKAGGDKPKVFSHKKTSSYKIPIFSNGITNQGLYGYTDIARINKPSITISARGTIGFTVLRIKPFVPIIRLIVVTPFFEYCLKYIEETIKYIEFERSGSVQRQLPVPLVSKINVLLPPKSLLKKFSKLTTSSIKEIESLKEQNQQLTKLRDWLLPMLMNGQVKVNTL